MQWSEEEARGSRLPLGMKCVREKQPDKVHVQELAQLQLHRTHLLTATATLSQSDCVRDLSTGSDISAVGHNITPFITQSLDSADFCLL